MSNYVRQLPRSQLWSSIFSDARESRDGRLEVTQEERSEIAAKASRRMQVTKQKPDYGSSHSQSDWAQEYVTTDGRAQPKSYLSQMAVGEYEMAFTPQKRWKDRSRIWWQFRNIVFCSDSQRWLLSRISSERCVMASVEPGVLQSSVDGIRRDTMHRAEGIHWARVGLPRVDWEYVFQSLEATYPGCTRRTAGLVKSDGYYWLDATWGTSYDSAYFTIRSSADKTDKVSEDELKEITQALGGHSAKGLMSFALSLRRREDSKRANDWQISLQCHSVDVEIEVDPALAAQHRAEAPRVYWGGCASMTEWEAKLNAELDASDSDEEESDAEEDEEELGEGENDQDEEEYEDEDADGAEQGAPSLDDGGAPLEAHGIFGHSHKRKRSLTPMSQQASSSRQVNLEAEQEGSNSKRACFRPWTP